MSSVSSAKSFPEPLSASRSGRPLTYGGMLLERLAVVPVTVSITLVLAALVNPIQPVTDSRVSATDPLLLLRLSVAFLACLVGLWGVSKSQTTRALLGSLPGIMLTALAVLFLATSVFANEQTAMISRASALIFVGYLLLTATAVVILGVRGIVTAILVGSTIYLLIAWSVFLLVPSVGHFHEFTDATTSVVRMGGLAHPNGIAREAAVTLILALAMIRGHRSDFGKTRLKRACWLLLIGLTVATLLATLSRTSALAAIAAVGMLMFDKLYGRRGALLITGIIIIGLAGFLYTSLTSNRSVGETATATFTKSGNVEELTSLTGRTEIWAEALSLIAQRPLSGYGLDSAATVMSEEAVGTHNLMLYVLLSAGVFAGIVMLFLIAATFYIALASRQPLFRGLATYVLVSGLVEDTLFDSFPSPLTLLWIMMLLSMALPRSTEPDSPSVRTC